jgi:hypothetical protein
VVPVAIGRDHGLAGDQGAEGQLVEDQRLALEALRVGEGSHGRRDEQGKDQRGRDPARCDASRLLTLGHGRPDYLRVG